MENEEKASEESNKGENESEEDKELEDDKDLVEHSVKAVEHISSETAQELDESAENENIKKVEAALFISGRFLTLQELVMLTDINPLMIKEILEKLIEKYNDNSGIEIIEKGGGWKMDVRQEHVSMINKLATGNAEFTKAEQETLAVIAYKQPVKQSVIINIRGNKAYDHIKHFVNINLVQAKKLGRTRELKLSDDFFEYFHLGNQKEISDDHSSSESIEELGDLQKKGDGSTEIIGIEKNEEDENKRVLEENEQEDKTEKVDEEVTEEEKTAEEIEEQDKKIIEEKTEEEVENEIKGESEEKIVEEGEKEESEEREEEEAEENQEGVKKIKMESESDVESEAEAESPPDENSEDLEKE